MRLVQQKSCFRNPTSQNSFSLFTRRTFAVDFEFMTGDFVCWQRRSEQIHRAHRNFLDLAAVHADEMVMMVVALALHAEMTLP